MILECQIQRQKECQIKCQIEWMSAKMSNGMSDRMTDRRPEIKRSGGMSRYLSNKRWDELSEDIPHRGSLEYFLGPIKVNRPIHYIYIYNFIYTHPHTHTDIYIYIYIYIQYTIYIYHILTIDYPYTYCSTLQPSFDDERPMTGLEASEQSASEEKPFCQRWAERGRAQTGLETGAKWEMTYCNFVWKWRFKELTCVWSWWFQVAILAVMRLLVHPNIPSLVSSCILYYGQYSSKMFKVENQRFSPPNQPF